MKECDIDAREAVKLVRDKGIVEPCFKKHCTSFLFTTENQEGISKVIDYKGKDVLTVAASGDQYISSVYYGAGNVDIFDINKFSYYITCLKVASLVSLDYETFVGFLIPVHNEGIEKSFWNLRTLKKVIKNMPTDVAYFWDLVMYECKKHGFDGNFVIPNHRNSTKCNVIKGMPFYSSPEEYYKLQSLLKKREYPKYYEVDLLELSSVVTDSYDVIYLSNIVECLVSSEMRMYYGFTPGYNSENMVEERYIFDIARQVMPRLRENGEILYSYRPNSSKEYSTDVLYRNDYFDVTEVDCKYPPSSDYNKTYDTDLVLTYKPSKSGNILDCLK
ncbi:MAG TPA: hypothetical protein DCE23_02790 [Firmicutes bacterium]|nr:hypothetical protein [Bacillota bacterium]